MTPKYRIRCWIPADPDEDETYETLEQAERDLKHYELLQPENVYRIEKIEEDGEDNEVGGRV